VEWAQQEQVDRPLSGGPGHYGVDFAHGAQEGHCSFQKLDFLKHSTVMVLHLSR
jgi:hypothetical protein